MRWTELSLKFSSQVTQTKKTKNVQKTFLPVFCNKGMDQLNLNRIFKSNVSIAHLSRKIQVRVNVPLLTCRLTPTIRNNISNYKETVQPVILHDKVSFFSAPTHHLDIILLLHIFLLSDHFITGDSILITNTKQALKVSSKRTKYMEPNSISYSQCKIAIDSLHRVDNCIEKLSKIMQT